MKRLFWSIPGVLATLSGIAAGAAYSQSSFWFCAFVASAAVFTLIQGVVNDVRPWTVREAYGVLVGLVSAMDWDKTQVRVCVYKPTWWSLGHVLKQVTPYAPNSTWRSGIKYQLASKGAVGRAYRTKGNTATTFTSVDDRLKKCVSAFGYTSKGAGRLRDDRTAVGAFCVKNDDDIVTHIVYFDSSDDTITDEQLKESIAKPIQRAAQHLSGVC